MSGCIINIYLAINCSAFFISKYRIGYLKPGRRPCMLANVAGRTRKRLTVLCEASGRTSMSHVQCPLL